MFDSSVIINNYAFFLVCCGCGTSYTVSVHIQCQRSLHYIPFHCVAGIMAGAASQAGDADSSRAPDLTSGLQGTVNQGSTVRHVRPTLS